MSLVVVALLGFSGWARADARGAFERLKALNGRWETKSSRGTPIEVRYRTVSAGTTVVQSYRPGTEGETVTVFHPDGGRLMATHYCAQGNQPRLVLEPRSTADRLFFKFLDSTGELKGVGHLVELELRFQGNDQYVAVETYDEGGKPDITELTFRRAKP